jgi:hypothetical protein
MTYSYFNHLIPILSSHLKLPPTAIAAAPFSKALLCLYVCTPRSRACLERLIVSLQLVKQFPAFHVTQKFIFGFTKAHHLSLS